jgi:CBS domain-containing protein
MLYFRFGTPSALVPCGPIVRPLLHSVFSIFQPFAGRKEPAMTTFAQVRAMRPLVLRSTTAGEIMTARPLLLDACVPVQKAAALLKHHGLEAAPVIDDAGRPLGVVTAAACAAWEDYTRRSSPGGVAARPDWTAVSEIANPGIDLAPLDAKSAELIDILVERRARRVYIVDQTSVLVGVVSMSDIARQLSESNLSWPARRASALRLC